MPVKEESVHRLVNQGREFLTEQSTRELQKRPWHDQRDEFLAVSEEQREQRADNGALPGAHNHLVAQRAPVRRLRPDVECCFHEPYNERVLRSAEHHAVGKLEHHEPWVIFQAAVLVVDAVSARA